VKARTAGHLGARRQAAVPGPGRGWASGRRHDPNPVGHTRRACAGHRPGEGHRLPPVPDQRRPVAAYLDRLAATIGAAVGEEITANEGDPGAALLAILDAFRQAVSVGAEVAVPC
jgi:hypothetical protein